MRTLISMALELANQQKANLPRALKVRSAARLPVEAFHLDRAQNSFAVDRLANSGLR